MIPSKITKEFSPGFKQKLPPVPHNDILQGEGHSTSIKIKEQNLNVTSVLNKLIEKMEQRQSNISSTETKLSEINENMSKLVQILMNKWEGSLMNENKDRKQSNERKQENIKQSYDLDCQPTSLELRFKNINLKPPAETSSKNEVLAWVGQVCKRVISASFKLYENGDLDFKKSITFCSENILRNLIHLPRKLKEQYWETIDTCLKTELFPYYRLNYPQTEEKEVSSKLSGLIIQRDTLKENENDMCRKSGVYFKLSQNQNYNSQIMELFNFLMKFPSLSPGLKEESQTNSSNNSLGKLFRRDMQKIFQFVQGETNLIDIEDYDPSWKRNERMRQIPTLENYIKNNLILTIKQKEQNYIIEKDSEKMKKQLEEKFRSFKSIQIGQKLPQKLSLFSEKQIYQGNLKFKSPALMKMVSLWCSQLEKCFDPKQILRRETPWKMKDGSEKYLKKSEMIFLNLLLQRQNYQVTRQMNQIRRNSIEKQIEFADKPVNQELKKFSEQEAEVGLFCSSIFKLNESYLIKYLNVLIHRINLALKDFEMVQRVLRQKKNILDRFDKENYSPEAFPILNKTLQYIYSLSQELQNNNENLQSTPQLISFRIDDLLQCKYTSNQSQITAVYKFVQYLSHHNPGFLKIIKVKEKLDEENQDILINLLYRQSVVVQMQLTIKSQKSKFIQKSYQFNNYFHELEQSQFGPIMQMCNTWTNYDHRAKFYLNKTNLNNKKRKMIKVKQCCVNPQNHETISLPFDCSACSYFYYQYNFYQKHSKCRQCNHLTCCLCLFHESDTNNKQQIFPILKKDPQLMRENENICSSLPWQGGKILNINQKQMKLKSFKPVIYDSQFHLFTQNKRTQNWQVIEKFKFKFSQYQEKQRQKQIMMWFQTLTVSNLVFKSSETAQKYKHLNKQLAEKYYFIPKYFQKIHKSQQKAIAMIKRDLNDGNLNLIPGSMRLVQRINLSQNKIQSIKELNQNFPNIRCAMINSNEIKKIKNKDFNQWSNLTGLFLNSNKIESIQGMNRLYSLIQLDISNNKLSNFPQSICEMRNLLELNISSNQITQIPRQIDNMRKLQRLNISSLKLDSFPSQIGNLANLIQLDASNNKLTKLPRQFSQLQSLQKLNLSMNKISILPYQLLQLKRLTTLLLEKNQLQQLNQIDSLWSLTKIVVKNNKIISLPQSLTNLSDLNYLDASCNKITSLPQFRNKQLQTVIIHTNNFKQFPEELTKIDSLKQLRIDRISCQRIYQALTNWDCLQELQIFHQQLIQNSDNETAIQKIREVCQERNINFKEKN